MFVAFAEATRDVGLRVIAAPAVRTLALPERGVFGVVEGHPAAGALLAANLDAGLRTSRTTDDIAEILDGVHAELRAKNDEIDQRYADTPHAHGLGESIALALAVVEDDAIAFFHIGSPQSWLVGHGFMRAMNTPDLDARLGGTGTMRFFRAYVRAGDVALLLTHGAWAIRSQREIHDLVRTNLERTARDLANGRRTLADAAAVVLRVDEEPRIR